MHFPRFVSVGARSAIAAGLAVSLVLSSAPVQAFADPASDLDAARTQLSQIGSEYQRINDEIDRLSSDLQKTAQQIEKTAAELNESQRTLSEMAENGYKGGGITLQKVLFGSTSFQELISGIHYLGKVSDAQVETINRVKTAQEQLEKQQAEQTKAMDDAEKRLAEQAENQQRAQQLVSSLDSQVRAQIEQEAKNNGDIASGIESAEDAENTSGSIPSGDGGQISEGNKPSDDGGNNTPSTPTDPGVTPPANGGNTPQKPSRPENGGSNGGTSSVGAAALNIALQFEGAPYVTGGASPEVGFDCSGLTMYAYAQLGYSLPHSASGQMSVIQSKGRFTTNINELQYGDLVFFPGHVAFYVGGGNIFGARKPGTPASTCPMKYFGTFLGGGNL